VITAALDALSNRRVLLFGGKGGVGKTTIASLAALHYSQSQKTILFTTDPAGNLRDIFDQPPPNLVIEELDANALYDNFLRHNLDAFIEIADRGTYLDRDELRRFFELALPGIDELMAWMHIGELAEDEGNAKVIVDTAPTGHTLRMLGAGEHFGELASALDALEAKHRGMVRQFTRRNVRDAMDEFIDNFRDRAEARRAMLTDPSITAFVPVFLSEPWVVEQTKRLIAEVGIDVPVAILNRAVIEADCDRDRALQQRDEEAAKALAPLRVERMARSCVPLELSGARVTSPAPVSKRSAPEVTRDRLSPPRLVFFAGKGGVGKTTCASSLALQLAEREQVTILSVDPAHALRDVFTHESPPPNLRVETIDTRAKWRAFRDKLGDEIERAVSGISPGGLSVAYDTEAMQKLIEVAPPGADELFAIMRIADLIADTSQQRIIIDTAPTGHFLRLLELPQTAGEWVREFMRILLRYRDLIPAGSLGEELVQASRALKLLEETLHSTDAAVIVVTRAERIVVAETERLVATLRARDIKVEAIIANYVTPENDCACDQAMRAHEIAAIAGLSPHPMIIERRDRPPVALDEIATLLLVQM
jgi:arsenite-transporting ATPase